MKQKYELKDFLNVALFVVLYYAAFFVAMCAGYIPVLMTVLPLITGIVCGIPFMLFLTKVKKPGMILLMGLICGLLSLTTGSGIWPLITAVAASLLAELILWLLHYTSTIQSIFVYVVFTLWDIGFGLRLYLASFDSYRERLVEQHGEAYVSEMLSNVSGIGFWGSIVLTLVGGILGGLLGYAVFKKHFQKIGKKA